MHRNYMNQCFVQITQPRYFCRIDISLQSVILHMNLSQPRQGFRYPSGSRGKTSRHGVWVKAFCCISGTIHLCTSDMTPMYQTKLKITLKIFLFSNFITSYQQTMTFTSGLFVVKSFVAVF